MRYFRLKFIWWEDVGICLKSVSGILDADLRSIFITEYLFSGGQNRRLKSLTVNNFKTKIDRRNRRHTFWECCNGYHWCKVQPKILHRSHGTLGKLIFGRSLKFPVTWPVQYRDRLKCRINSPINRRSIASRSLLDRRRIASGGCCHAWSPQHYCSPLSPHLRFNIFILSVLPYFFPTFITDSNNIVCMHIVYPR